jgi:hypothetical protein
VVRSVQVWYAKAVKACPGCAWKGWFEWGWVRHVLASHAAAALVRRGLNWRVVSLSGFVRCVTKGWASQGSQGLVRCGIARRVFPGPDVAAKDCGRGWLGKTSYRMFSCGKAAKAWHVVVRLVGLRTGMVAQGNARSGLADEAVLGLQRWCLVGHRGGRFGLQGFAGVWFGS